MALDFTVSISSSVQSIAGHHGSHGKSADAHQHLYACNLCNAIVLLGKPKLSAQNSEGLPAEQNRELERSAIATGE